MIIEKPLVRMGANVVSATMRGLGSPLEIRVVEDRAHAVPLLTAA